jgi:copper chaperone
METQRFKTTIKCTGCIEKVTPYLNEVAGEDNWQVDLQNPDRVLTIIPGETVKEKAIIDALQKAGYKAERLS